MALNSLYAFLNKNRQYILSQRFPLYRYIVMPIKFEARINFANKTKDDFCILFLNRELIMHLNSELLAKDLQLSLLEDSHISVYANSDVTADFSKEPTQCHIIFSYILPDGSKGKLQLNYSNHGTLLPVNFPNNGSEFSIRLFNVLQGISQFDSLQKDLGNLLISVHDEHAVNLQLDALSLANPPASMEFFDKCQAYFNAIIDSGIKDPIKIFSAMFPDLPKKDLDKEFIRMFMYDVEPRDQMTFYKRIKDSNYKVANLLAGKLLTMYKQLNAADPYVIQDSRQLSTFLQLKIDSLKPHRAPAHHKLPKHPPKHSRPAEQLAPDSGEPKKKKNRKRK
jgi:hypothetical protein